MRLRNYPQSIAEQLHEFDAWITPSLGELKDTDQFKKTRGKIAEIIEILGSSTDGFNGELNSQVLSESVLIFTQENAERSATEIIETFLSFLFLVTGKSDNNCKCQFPVFLNENFPEFGYPEIKKIKKKLEIVKGHIPRVIKSENVASLTVKLQIDPDLQKAFVEKYINFVLNEEEYWKSLRSVGRGYFLAKQIGHELEYLLPLVIFQIKGSLSAIGGHEPEKLLRVLMKEWGLIENVDFNKIDHLIKDSRPVDESAVKSKTRAYDFVLPLVNETISDKVLIQSQYYAGDSGSVSHKNIDQTRTSRAETYSRLGDSVTFIEFLDGAGYFSSLNGDLKKLLQMEDTADFFQLRTAPIKLRRALQNIGLLSPLEFTHAVARNHGNTQQVLDYLLLSYNQTEIDRTLITCLESGVVVQNGNFKISSDYRDISRRYFLLDTIAEFGVEFDPNKVLSGVILIPGYSVRFGIKMKDIGESIIPNGGIFKEEWANSAVIFSDIQYLTDRKWIKQC